MAEYIEREAVKKTLHDSTTEMEQSIGYSSNVGVPEEDINYVIDEIPSADVVEVVRCKDCKFATELDKHCELNRAIYKHCSLLRGEPTNYVWHKYKRYYKNYSLVEADDYCSYGERKDGEQNGL